MCVLVAKPKAGKKKEKRKERRAGLQVDLFTGFCRWRAFERSVRFSGVRTALGAIDDQPNSQVILLSESYLITVFNLSIDFPEEVPYGN